MRPVVLVHGIWDSAARIDPLKRGLEARGIGWISAMDLVPPWGNAPLERLADQVAAHVERTCAIYAAPQVDLVGFSMGALVSRAYLALLGGHTRVRTFVSISAPHHGTWLAYGLPLAGVKQMRPNSAFLRRLGEGVTPLGNVTVHCLYTPFDAMIVPGHSGILEGASSVHRVPVPFHRLMLSDRRVLDRVAALLRF